MATNTMKIPMREHRGLVSLTRNVQMWFLDSQIIPYDIIQATSEETVVSETSVSTTKEMGQDAKSQRHSDALDGHWTNQNT